MAVRKRRTAKRKTTGRRRTKTVAVKAHTMRTASGRRVHVKAHRRAV